MHASRRGSRPKKPERVAINRSRRSESRISVLNIRKLTRILGLVSESVRFTDEIRPAIGSFERIRTLSKDPGRVSCDIGKNAIGEKSSRRFLYFVFFTRPTIS